MSGYFVCGAKDKNKTESGIRISLYDGQRHVATSTISPWNVLVLKQDLQVGNVMAELQIYNHLDQKQQIRPTQNRDMNREK